MNKEFDIRKRTLLYSIEIIKYFRNKKQKYDFIDQILIKQLIRAATSVGANVQESRGANSLKDYKNFFTIALKSANETRYWLKILIETSEFNTKELMVLYAEAEELSKIIASCIIKMEK